MNNNYHSKTIEEVFDELSSSKNGLSENEAKQRLENYGINEIKEKERISIFRIFISQFRSILILIMSIAIIISLFIKDYKNAAVIGAILIVNALLGFRQEFKAEKAIAALKKLISLHAVVLRNGSEKKIDAKGLVPGDIIILETGDKVPADARLVKTINLEAQQSALTGESFPDKKNIEVIDQETLVSDRDNMVYAGTIIVSGRGEAVITSTGMSTEIGKIATSIQELKLEQTPLQKNLAKFGKNLGRIISIMCALVFLIGLIAGFKLNEMFIITVALAVAAIPEGLPAVVTIALAVGTTKMAKRNALIRRLSSVETLGSTTVICTDKTGTLTLNQMTVRKIFANNKIYEVSGRGYETEEGEFTCNGKRANKKEIELLLQIGALCNNAKLNDGEIFGDPTEGALIVSAAKLGLLKDDLEEYYPRIAEKEFTSERKFMSTHHQIDGKKAVYTKGAPDVLLEFCDRIYIDGKIEKLTGEEKKRILHINDEFAKKALRILGFAFKSSSKLEEKDMVFAGLQAMLDPPRQEAKEAIAKCKKAGIKVVMVTGDYEMTAKAIASELGIIGKSINGQELQKVSVADLKNVVQDIAIYSRVNPQDKLKIIEALKHHGHIVAMTGDGINDAPAIKKADIGIAMGLSGTDVAKEASDMVLADDNFASIVKAVEEGRTVFDNIKTFIIYLFSGNIGEIFVVLSAVLLGMPLPLLALQILWINVTTETIPAVALSMEPTKDFVMKYPPRKIEENIIDKDNLFKMIAIGIIMTIGTLAVFKYFHDKNGLEYARTAAFTILVMFQMFNVLNCKPDKKLLSRINIFKNINMVGAMILSIMLQIVVVHSPLNAWFGTVPLLFIDWVHIIIIAATVLLFGEMYNIAMRKKAVLFKNG